MEHDLFYELLVADSLRGTHGTGICKVYTDGKSDWRKIAGDPFTLFNADGVRAFLGNHDKKDVRFLLGHNRAATTGARDNDCAHPFTIGDITLMHNGTLDKWCPLPDFETFAVDSEAICNAINKIGIEETLKKLRGAYTLVYYDGKAKTLNLIRNKERPLFIGAHPEAGRIYFASEYGMLRWILARNNIVTARIEELPVNTLFTFGIDSLSPIVRDMSAFQFKTVYSGYQESEYWKNREYDQETGTWKEKPKVEEPEQEEFDWSQLFRKLSKKDKKAKRQLALVALPKEPLPRKEKTVAGEDVLRPIGDLTQTSKLYIFEPGQRIHFDLVDYRKVDKNKDTFILEGSLKGYPEIKILSWIAGGTAELDKLLEGKMIKGIIRNIQYNNHQFKNKEAKHRIWISFPEPINMEGACEECGHKGGVHSWNCKKASPTSPGPNNDFVDVEVADIVADIKKEQADFPLDLGNDTIN